MDGRPARRHGAAGAAGHGACLYQSMTHGWLIGEIVRRTDPGFRTIGKFVREEIAEAARDHRICGSALPDKAAPRLARPGGLRGRRARRTSSTHARLPPQVDMVPAVFERPDVRAARDRRCRPGIFNARSSAASGRCWPRAARWTAVRLLSADSRSQASTGPLGSARRSRHRPLFGGQVCPASTASGWAARRQPSPPRKYPSAICHPRRKAIRWAWANPATRLGAADLP